MSNFVLDLHQGWNDYNALHIRNGNCVGQGWEMLSQAHPCCPDPTHPCPHPLFGERSYSRALADPWSLMGP